MTIFVAQPPRESTRRFIPSFLNEMAGAVAEFLVENGFEIEPMKVWSPDDEDQSGPKWGTTGFYAWRGKKHFTISIDHNREQIIAGCHKSGVGFHVLLHDPQSLDKLLDYMGAQC